MGLFREDEQVHRKANHIRVDSSPAGHARRGRSGAKWESVTQRFTTTGRSTAGCHPQSCCRLKQFEDENAKLKRLVVDMPVGKAKLHDIFDKKL